MNHCIDIQNETNDALPITENDILAYAELALSSEKKAVELSIKLINAKTMQTFNRQYRQKDKPTNVLAFPSDIPDELELEVKLLGDILICPSVLEEERKEQQIDAKAHFAHIVIHGVLHLLGYDHIKDDDAAIMQAKEALLLKKAGFANPYDQED